MGHWDATTLGNDLALDCIAEFVGMKDTAEICDALTDAFRAPTNDDGTYDSPECAWIRAVAELVASGLGRPTRHVTEGVDEWIAVHGDLTAESADDAFEALEIVGRSPYAEQWVRPKSVDVFQSSQADLCERLRAGRTALLKPVKTRFLDHVARLLGPDWKVRKGDATAELPCAGGVHRVRFQMLGKHGLWKAGLRFELALYEPQQVVFDAIGREHPKRACVVAVPLPRKHYHPLGKIPHLRLYQPGVDVPPGDELERKGLRPRDILNPERTVRLAAERAALLVRAFSPVVFGKYGSLDDLRPISERCDPEEIVRLCPVGTSYVWAAIGWAHDPELGRRYINVRREKLAPFERSEVQVSLEQLDAIEAALEAHYGG